MIADQSNSLNTHRIEMLVLATLVIYNLFSTSPPGLVWLDRIIISYFCFSPTFISSAAKIMSQSQLYHNINLALLFDNRFVCIGYIFFPIRTIDMDGLWVKQCRMEQSSRNAWIRYLLFCNHLYFKGINSFLRSCPLFIIFTH